MFSILDFLHKSGIIYRDLKVCHLAYWTLTVNICAFLFERCCIIIIVNLIVDYVCYLIMLCFQMENILLDERGQ